jgi:hypothetical protein
MFPKDRSTTSSTSAPIRVAIPATPWAKRMFAPFKKRVADFGSHSGAPGIIDTPCIAGQPCYNVSSLPRGPRRDGLPALPSVSAGFLLPNSRILPIMRLRPAWGHKGRSKALVLGRPPHRRASFYFPVHLSLNGVLLGVSFGGNAHGRVRFWPSARRLSAAAGFLLPDPSFAHARAPSLDGVTGFRLLVW